ncbi:phosphatase PAP2 family protein [Bacillus manliponensis]|uniref:phosphatase PAP2 family protein n=1 Tax=Bacillus manliponensis TaxID=574376 RepID=UPI0035153657
MKQKLHVYEIIAITTLALIFSFIALHVRAGGVIELDEYVKEMVKGLQTERSIVFFSYFTKFGSAIGIVVAVVIGMLIFWKKRLFAAFLIYPIAVISTHFINQLLKIMIGRERPSLNEAVDGVGYSFPSGHAMLAVVTYGFITYMAMIHMKSKAGKLFITIVATIWIVWIGLSRVILNVHYPTDIIAGFCAGGILLIVAMYFNRFLHFTK